LKFHTAWIDVSSKTPHSYCHKFSHDTAPVKKAPYCRFGLNQPNSAIADAIYTDEQGHPADFYRVSY
jgi:hypothetical protein